MSAYITKLGDIEVTSSNSHLSKSGKYKIQIRTGYEEVGRTGRSDWKDMKVSDCEHYYKALEMRIGIYEIIPSHPDLPQYIARGCAYPRINFEGELEYVLDIEHESGRNTYIMHLSEVEAVNKLTNWAVKYHRK
jgi:hypothetical protein